MRKYLAIFKAGLSNTLIYRSEMVGNLILELMFASSIVFLWLSVYDVNDTIGGYTLNQTIFYYLLVPFVGFIIHTNVSYVIGYDIRHGKLSGYLVKPYKIWAGAFASAVAQKINFLAMTLPLYMIALVLYIVLTKDTALGLANIAVAFLITVLAFILHFTIDIALAWLAFWYDDVWAFSHFKDILFAVFGGVMFPFSFLPTNVRVIFELLPFKYMFYVPISYLQGTRSFNLLIIDIAGIFIWSVVFAIFAYILWVKGIKKYEAFGN